VTTFGELQKYNITLDDFIAAQGDIAPGWRTRDESVIRGFLNGLQEAPDNPPQSDNKESPKG